MNTDNKKRRYYPTLKSIRMDKGLTQKEIAEITNGTDFPIPQSTLSAWEVGTAVPNANAIIFLAGLYGCSFQELVEGWRNTKKNYEENNSD